MVSQQLKSVFLVSLFFAMMVGYGSNAESRKTNLRKRDLRMTSGGIASDASPNYQDSNANPTRAEITNVSSEEPVVAEPYRTTISVQQQQQQGNEPNESTHENDINPLRQTIIDNLVVGNGREVPAPDQANPNSVVGRERYTWNEVIGYDAPPADPYQAEQQEQASDTQTNTNPLHVVNVEQEQDGTNNVELPSEENIFPLRPEPAEDISTAEAQVTATQHLRGRPSNP